MIRETTYNFNNSKIVGEENSRFLVIVKNPQFPKLYGLPKIHKLGNSIRPI